MPWESWGWWQRVGHQEHMMKLVGAVVLCFLATAVEDLPPECACLECGNYFRRHLFLLIFLPNLFSSHLQRQHPQGHTLISIVCERTMFLFLQIDTIPPSPPPPPPTTVYITIATP